MMKKILISLIIILAVALATFFLWPSGEKISVTGPNEDDSSPFGSGENLPQPESDLSDGLNDISGESLLNEQGIPVAGFFQLSSEPVAGAVIFTRGQLSVTRYIDRATGHITEIVLPVGQAVAPLQRVKIDNNTIPKIYEAHFRPDGNAVLLRTLKDDSDIIENTILTLTPPRATSTTLYSISTTLLRDNIDEVAVGDGNNFFYSTRNSGLIVSAAFNSSALRTIFDAGISGWHISPVTSNLLMYPKASASTAGYVYRLNNGTLTKLIGPLNGITALMNSLGNRLIYSYMDSGEGRSYSKNLQSGAISEILPSTLAEKCVWSVKKANIVICASPIDGIVGNEPDAWYQGRRSFSDRVWLFDTDRDLAQVLVEPKARFNIDVDVIEPKLSPNEDYLIFTNKRDLSLWALRLEKF